jgi:hypothetical protein
MKTVQLFIFAFLFACGIQGVYAQLATQAPAPTHDSEDVLSLFSNYYTLQSGCKGIEVQSWGGSTIVTEKITGFDDDVLKTSGSSAVAFTSGWKAQTKGYVHLDIYSVSGGSFSFGLGDGFSNSNIKWLTDYNWANIPAQQWTSVDVPVVEFVKSGLNDAVNIQIIKFSGNGTYYIDNIYAYGEKETYIETARIAVAPTPGRLASDVKSVFSDTYPLATKGFQPQTFGGILAKIMPYEDTRDENVVRLSGLGTSLATIDTWKITDKLYIHLDVYYDAGGDGSFSFGLASNSWDGNQIKYADSYPWPSTKQGNWVAFDIPTQIFADAGVDVNQITQIKFKGSGTFYIDNLYAHPGGEELDSDATLKTLSVNPGVLDPEFNALITQYNVNVPLSTTFIQIIAETNSTNATLTGRGVKDLEVGKTNLNIEVTAKSGAKKTYTVTVTRGDPSTINSVDASTKISAENGFIRVSLDGKISVRLYSFTGQLLDQTIATGSYNRAVDTGIYILSLNGKTYKIRAK